jgi:hypothetical protein
VTSNRLCICPLQPLRLGLANHTSFHAHAPEHVNVVTIAPDRAIADTGATSIFIMEGTDVANKRVAVRPLTISLPDGQQIKSTHVCNIQIVGLPTILKGHIVLSLNVTSLIGIRPLCKAGCIVTFDDMKCDVTYNGTVIIRGFKDPSTDLWTLPIPNKVSNTPIPALPRTGPCSTRATHHATEIPPTNNIATFTHSVRMRANAVRFAHQSLCSSRISTLLKAVWKGFLKGCPNMTKTLILKYLNPSPATTKGHMKRPRHGIRSTRPKPTRNGTATNIPVLVAQIAPQLLPLFGWNPIRCQLDNEGPNIIIDEDDLSTANIFCFGAFADKTSGIVYHDLTGSFPFMSFDGSICFFVMYHYESKRHTRNTNRRTG